MTAVWSVKSPENDRSPKLDDSHKGGGGSNLRPEWQPVGVLGLIISRRVVKVVLAEPDLMGSAHLLALLDGRSCGHWAISMS